MFNHQHAANLKSEEAQLSSIAQLLSFMTILQELVGNKDAVKVLNAKMAGFDAKLAESQKLAQENKDKALELKQNELRFEAEKQQFAVGVKEHEDLIGKKLLGMHQQFDAEAAEKQTKIDEANAGTKRKFDERDANLKDAEEKHAIVRRNLDERERVLNDHDVSLKEREDALAAKEDKLQKWSDLLDARHSQITEAEKVHITG